MLLHIITVGLPHSHGEKSFPEVVLQSWMQKPVCTTDRPNLLLPKAKAFAYPTAQLWRHTAYPNLSEMAHQKSVSLRVKYNQGSSKHRMETKPWSSAHTQKDS